MADSRPTTRLIFELMRADVRPQEVEKLLSEIVDRASEGDEVALRFLRQVMSSQPSPQRPESSDVGNDFTNLRLDDWQGIVSALLAVPLKFLVSPARWAVGFVTGAGAALLTVRKIPAVVGGAAQQVRSLLIERKHNRLVANALHPHILQDDPLGESLCLMQLGLQMQRLGDTKRAHTLFKRAVSRAKSVRSEKSQLVCDAIEQTKHSMNS